MRNANMGRVRCDILSENTHTHTYIYIWTHMYEYMDTHTHTHTHLDTHSHIFGHTFTHIWTHTHVPSGRCPGTLGSCWSCGRSDRCSCVCGFIYCDVHTNMIKNVSIQWVNTHTHMYKYIITHTHTYTNTHTHTSYPWLSGTLMGVH
jgi:hypothetical protein